MAETTTQKPEKNRLRKIALFTVAFSLLSMVAMIAMVFLLPLAVSTQTFREIAQERISAAAGRAVHMRKLVWRWNRGIRIDGIELADDPAFSEKSFVKIHSILLNFQPEKLFQRRLVFDLEIDGMEGKVIRDKDGRFNLETLLFPQGDASPIDSENSPVILPFDITGTVWLKNFTMEIEDRLENRSAGIRNGNLHLDVPDLRFKPVSIDISADVLPDGGDSLPVDLKFLAENLLNPDLSINRKDAMISLHAALLGAKISLKAGVADFHVKADCSMDLAILNRVSKPYLTGILSDFESLGEITFSLETSGDPLQEMTFTTHLNATGLSFSGGLTNGQTLGPIHGGLSAAGIFQTGAGGVTVTSLTGAFQEDCKLTLKGTGSGFKGPVDEMVIDVALDLDFEPGEIAELIRPLLPEEFTAIAPGGRVAVDINVSGKPSERLSFDFEFKGDDLILSGGLLLDRSMGPVGLRLFQEGVFYPGKGSAVVDRGALEVGRRSHLLWSGSFEELRGASPLVDISLESIHFDLAEMAEPGRQFIPENFFPLPGQFIKIEKIEISGPVPGGPISVGIDDFRFEAPDLRLAVDTHALDFTDLSFHLEHLKTTVVNNFPEQLQGVASLAIERLASKGANPFYVDDLMIPLFSLDIGEIRKSSVVPGGVQATALVEVVLDTGRVIFSDLLEMPAFSQSLNAGGHMNPDGSVELSVHKFHMSTPMARLRPPEMGGMITTAAAVDLSLTTMATSLVDLSRVDMTGLRVDLSLGDMVKMGIEADLTESGVHGLETNGDLFLDISKLPDFMLSEISNFQNFSGKMEAKWNFSGRLPTGDEMGNLKNLPQTGLKEGLGFADRIEISCRLSDFFMESDVDEKEPFVLGPLSTGTPIRYSYDGRSAKGSLTGSFVPIGVRGGAISQLQIPLEMEFSLAAFHEDLKTVAIEETLLVRPLNIEQSLKLNISGMDRILSSGAVPTLPMILKELNTKIQTAVRIHEISDLQGLPVDVTLDGELSAGVDLEIKAGDFLAIGARSQTPGLSMELDGKIRVNELQLDVDIEKAWNIVATEPVNESHSPLSLSTRVLFPDSGLFLRDERGGERPIDAPPGVPDSRDGSPSISMESIQLEGGRLPIELAHLSADVDLRGGLPYSRRFSVELLGGTIMGTVSVGRKERTFVVWLTMGFSGIDTGRITSDTIEDDDSRDTELGGEVNLAIPLVSSMDDLMESMELDLEFTHIGEKALDRILYSLDPYESNEVIVSQRNLLSTGTPRRIRLTIKDGSLSLGGEAVVQGNVLTLPRLDRFNISSLPGLAEYDDKLVLLEPVVAILEILSAEGFVPDSRSKSGIRFIY
jgi:translocation and assembly module TamB